MMHSNFPVRPIFLWSLCMITLPWRSTTTLGRGIDRIEMNVKSIESKKPKMQFLKELIRTSRDSLESESNLKESRDVRRNSFKSGIFHFAILGRIKLHLPGFFRIGIRFERISGRLWFGCNKNLRTIIQSLRTVTYERFAHGRLRSFKDGKTPHFTPSYSSQLCTLQE